MLGKHMKEANCNTNDKLLEDKDFKIHILENQLEHKNNEMRDFKKDVLDILKRITNIGEANSCGNSQVAIKKMKEISEENYKRIAIDLYNLDLENEIELPTTGKSSK